MKSLIQLSLLLLSFSIYSCGNTTAPETEEATPEATTTSTTAQQESSYQDLNVAEFQAMMQEENVVLLDVRTPEETADGIIEGAIEVDFNDREAFKEFVAGMDQDKTYLVYCRSGNRSGKACKFMGKKGATKLYNLEGGYLAWQAAMDPATGN